MSEKSCPMCGGGYTHKTFCPLCEEEQIDKKEMGRKLSLLFNDNKFEMTKEEIRQFEMARLAEK